MNENQGDYSAIKLVAQGTLVEQAGKAGDSLAQLAISSVSTGTQVKL